MLGGRRAPVSVQAALVIGIALVVAGALVALVVPRRSALVAATRTRDRIVELMREGVVVIDRDDTIVDANPAVGRLLGIDVRAGMDALDALPAWLVAIVRRTGAGEEAESLHHEVLGRVLDVTVTSIAADADESRGHRIVVVRDGTSRARAERHLETLAHTDTITGLPNRVQLDLDLTPRLAVGEGLAFMLLDLDGFKAVNDTYGHGTGDDLLMKPASDCARRSTPTF